MLTITSFTSSQVFLGFAGIVAMIFLAIYGARLYLSKVSASNLTEKYRGKVWSSPLEARNKYPDVDIFKYSATLLRFSSVVTLLAIILAMNWTQLESKVVIPQGALDMEFDLEVEPPRSAEPPAPPPPPPPPVIEEVPAGAEVEEDEFEFRDNSLDENSDINNAPVASNTPKAPPPPPPPPPPPAEPEVAEIFKVVEEMPRFPGCESEGTLAEKKACADQKLLQFIYANIAYPSIARENGVEGTVVIRFVVNEKGLVSDSQILRDVGAGCGDEALRVVNLMNNMPERWTPGRQRGRAVKVYYTLPVKFVLKANS